MFETVSYEETLNTDKTKAYIDCRSPLEFEESSIPNAINIPTLLDKEREIIGTLYVNGQIEQAKIEGIKAVSKRLPQMVEQIIQIRKEYENLYFFCARGGYRSSAIVNMLIGIGIKSYKLSGGYKGYRKYVMDNMQKAIDSVDFITLYGYTGTGKTSILDEIKNQGQGVIDLEKYANHRGSLLGSIGKSKQHSQKKFESLLFEDLIKHKGRYVFVEGESQRIGNIVMSKNLYEKLRGSKKILIEADMDFRVKEIKTQYLNDFDNDKELIKKTLSKLERYISKEKIQRYNELIDNDEYEDIISELCTTYYDRNYKLPRDTFEKIYMNSDSKETAKNILKDYNEEIGHYTKTSIG